MPVVYDALFCMDGQPIWVDGYRAHYGLVHVAADTGTICLYRADSPADECSYDFSEDDGWIKDDSIHIFACKEVDHAD